jgi:hypothetical protein
MRFPSLPPMSPLLDGLDGCGAAASAAWQGALDLLFAATHLLQSGEGDGDGEHADIEERAVRLIDFAALAGRDARVLMEQAALHTGVADDARLLAARALSRLGGIAR